MHALAAVLAAGLLGAVAIPGGTGDARVDAASATYDVASGSYRLEGDVVIARGVVRLRAHTARYDPRTGVVEASGDVLLTDARQAVTATGIHAVIDGDYEAHDVVAFLKDGPVDLTRAATPAEAAACGRNAAIAHADLVTGGQDGTLHLEGARVTPCDCPVGPPSWELRASRAVVHPGQTVALSWPVLWITPRFLFVDRPVPVFALPWISLPLGDRVTGMLVPFFGSTGVTGFTVAQPVFVTLGQSADLTVTPRWFFGRKRAQVEEGKPSVRGPAAALEGRWTPAEATAGRLLVEAAWDMDPDVGPLATSDGSQGLRLALSGVWAQRLSGASWLRADLDMVGDPLYVRDFTPDVMLRGATVRRSAVVASHRGEDTAVELAAAYLEPVSSSGELATVDGGLFGFKFPAFQRWPALTVTLLPTALVGPLELSGHASIARFAPVNGYTSDSGVAGVGPGERGLPGIVWPGPDTGLMDHQWESGERLAATRLDARAELGAPFTLGDVVALAPSLRGAVAGYVFDTSSPSVLDAWASAGLTASTAFVRRDGTLRHELTPRLEWRATSGVQGGALPAFGYDGWDRGSAVPPGTVVPSGAVPPGFTAGFPGQRLAAAAPPGFSNQLRLAVATRLLRGEQELLRAEIGQEVDLRRGALAEGYVRASATRGLVSGDADLRFWTTGRLDPAPQPIFPSWLDTFSEAHVSAAVSDPRGDELRAGLLAVGSGGSGRLGAGVDDLFDPRVTGMQALASGSLAARVRLGPATVGYDVMLPVRASTVPVCQGTGSRTTSPFEVQQQVGSFEWDSPCRCFRLRAAISLDTCGDVGGKVTFDLGRSAGLAGR